MCQEDVKHDVGHFLPAPYNHLHTCQSCEPRDYELMGRKILVEKRNILHQAYLD